MKKWILPAAAGLAAAVMLAGCGRESGKIGRTNEYMNEEEQKQIQSELNKKGQPSEAPDSTPEPRATAAEAPKPEKSKAGEKQNESKTQSVLDEAKSMADAGLVEDAKEMLSDVEEDGLTEAQKQELEQVVQKLKETDGGADAAGAGDENFSAEDACKMINERYGIEGDPGGMTAAADSDGRRYFQVKFQYQQENVLIDVKVYSDGTIQEISRTPIAVG